MSAAQKIRDARRGVRGRATGLVAGIAVAAMALTSCGTVPGAAVDIDGSVISQEVVQQRTQALIDENIPADAAATLDPTTRAMYNRFQVTELIRHRLVLRAAKAENITVDEAQVNSFIASYGGAASVAQNLSVPLADVSDAAYDYMVLSKLVDKIPDAGVEVTNVTVTVDAVKEADRADAVAARAKYLNDPAAMDRDAAAAKASGQAPGGEESLLQSSQDAVTGIFTAPEGEIVLFPVPTGGYFVIRVTKRTEEPATLTKDIVGSVQSLDGYLALSSLLLRKYARDSDIQVNPRFGDWDPKTLQVIPSSSGM